MIREWIDQRLHWLLGYAMGRSLRGTAGLAHDEAVEMVMLFAEARERAQHPDGEGFGEGSMRDLRWWRKGAEAGVG